MVQPTHQDTMIAHWEHQKSYTKDYLETMPEDDYSFRATPEMRTFAQQYLHIAGINYLLLSLATGVENPYPGDTLEHTPSVQTKKAVMEITIKSYDAVIGQLKKMTAQQLEETVMLFGEETTKAEVIFKAYENQMHHRGQTVVYMRLKGIKPPVEKLH